MERNKWYYIKDVENFIRFGQRIELVYSQFGSDLGYLGDKNMKGGGDVYFCDGYVVRFYKGGWETLELILGGSGLNRVDFNDDYTESKYRIGTCQPEYNFGINGLKSVNAQIRFIDGPGLIGEEEKKNYTALVEGSANKIKDKYNMDKLKAVQIEVKRVKGESLFCFEVAPEITDFFKELAKGVTKTSENWKGLEFYISKGLQDDPYYKEKLNQYHLFDNHGSSLISPEKKANIAWLRTVGGKGEIKIEDNIPVGVLQSYVQDTMKFLKEYLGDTFTEVKIVGNVTIEV